MTIDLSTIARAIQPQVILTSVQKLVARQQTERRPRREPRSMNG